MSDTLAYTINVAIADTMERNVSIIEIIGTLEALKLGVYNGIMEDNGLNKQ